MRILDRFNPGKSIAKQMLKKVQEQAKKHLPGIIISTKQTINKLLHEEHENSFCENVWIEAHADELGSLKIGINALIVEYSNGQYSDIIEQFTLPILDPTDINDLASIADNENNAVFLQILKNQNIDIDESTIFDILQ